MKSKDQKIVDHLFRHHYGKMVSTLTRFFGLDQLEIIEDAVQDTFIKAIQTWRNQIPDNPEAWLTKAAKNRSIDLFRQIKAEKNRFDKISSGSSAIHLNDMFLDHEIEDSQLRMIFVACHPSLDSKEQIAFALKTISGFSIKEIASALLVKEETIKKRLTRARKKIKDEGVSFEFPAKHELASRLNRVMEVIYLSFNEGFHSNNKEKLIREDLCGEALRLCKLMLTKEDFRSGKLYALFALLCFHSSRLNSKTNEKNQIVDIKNQDRKKWYQPLINLAFNALQQASSYEDYSYYHIEALIAAEHIKAESFDKTNWGLILDLYLQLNKISSTPSTNLNIAIVHLQMNNLEQAFQILNQIDSNMLEQRAYLYFASFAEYYIKKNQSEKANQYLDQAILKVNNELEKEYLIEKRKMLSQHC